MAEIVTTHGYQKRLQIGVQSAFGTPVAATEVILWATENFGASRPEEKVPGVTGGQDVYIGQARHGLLDPRGTVSTAVRVGQHDFLMGLILPYDNSGVRQFHNAGVGVEQKLITVEINKAGDLYQLGDGRVGTATLRSSPGQNLMAEYSVVGATWDETFAAMTGSLDAPTGYAFQHTDLAVTVDPSGTPITLTPASWEISVNHNLAEDIYHNSATRTAIPSGIREVMYRMELPWNSTMATLLGRWRAGTPLALRSKFTAGSDSIQFDSAQCRITGGIPDSDAERINGPLSLEIKAYGSVFATNDSLTCAVVES